ncbi:MAG TPA: glycosyltransferase family 87 protein [Acidimicrobiales bacterium]|jgi:hypothetical protein
MTTPVRTSEQGIDAPTDPDGIGATAARPDRFTDRTLALVVMVVSLPILWMGYGTDIDVFHVLDTADGIWHGDYHPSRTPGVPVFEAVAAVTDPIGGHLLLNLATAVAAAFCVVGIARLVRTWGHDNGDLLALAFFASPVTIIASTSVADFIWALAFFVWGALAQLRNRSVLAGVLFALAIGSRLSTGFLIAAFLVADGWDPPNRRRCLHSALVAAPIAVALYVPSWLYFDRSMRFLETAEGYRGFANNLGRFLYKNYANAGVALLVVLLIAAPALLASLRRWGQDPMLRFAVLAFIVTELLFFQLPWKGAHLLPSLLALVIWLGATTRNQRKFLWVVIAATALNGLVSFRPLAPDDPEKASTGQWDPSLGWGLLLNDIDCRLDSMDEVPTNDRSGEAWDCTLKPMRGPTAEP